MHSLLRSAGPESRRRCREMAEIINKYETKHWFSDDAVSSPTDVAGSQQIWQEPNGILRKYATHDNPL